MLYSAADRTMQKPSLRSPIFFVTFDLFIFFPPLPFKFSFQVEVVSVIDFIYGEGL